MDWTEILNSDCPERALEIYVSMMDDFVDRTVPLKRRKKKGKKDKPWRNNPEVLKVLRERRRAERAWEKNKTPLTKKQFNELKRQFGRVDKGARIEYVRDDLEASKDDPGALQRKLDRLLGKSETLLPETGNKQKLAEDFADYFLGKVENILTTVREERTDLPGRSVTHVLQSTFEEFE